MRQTIYVVCLSACGALGFAQSTPAPAVPTATVAKPAARPVKAKKAAARPVIAKKAAARPTPLATIPAGAVKTPEGAYRYKDAQGKSWLYRETPFGVSRSEETSRPASSANTAETPFGPSRTSVVAAAAAEPHPDSAGSAQITAVAKGDVIYFQKPTPFGMTSWQKSRNNLTAEEQKVWDREQAKGTR